MILFLKPLQRNLISNIDSYSGLRPFCYLLSVKKCYGEMLYTISELS